jgi:preprotein translocase subunit YajC
VNLQEFLASPIPLVIGMGAIFYLLLWRPQQQRAKQLREMVANVRRGDTVVLTSGMIGKVAKVKDETEVLVEIADNVQVRVLKGAISEVRAKGADADKGADKG